MASILTAVGIFITFGIAVANLWYSYTNSKKTGFINTVTSSRILWINSLRDKVSAFISVTIRLTNPDIPKDDKTTVADLIRERDTLMPQIILHLNPKDPTDQAIKKCVEEVFAESEVGVYSHKLVSLLTHLREATGGYLKKEWEKVKNESEKGRLSKNKNE
jgi:hypothetical protein